MKFEQPPITDLGQVLSTSNSEALWSRPVNLSGVAVQRNLHDEGFILVGPDREHTILVRMEKPQPGLREGEKVDLTGIINPMGKDLSQWNVKPTDRMAFQGHTMFIIATSVTETAKR